MGDIDYSHDRKLLASVETVDESTGNSKFIVWDVERREPRYTLFSKAVNQLAFSPCSGDLVVVGASWNATGYARILDTDTGRWKPAKFPCATTEMCATYHPDGRRLAIGENGGVLTVWDLASGTANETFSALGGNVICLAYSPDGQTLAVGSIDHTVRLLHVATGSQLARLPTLRVPASLSFSDDGSSLVAGLTDGTVRSWSINGQTRVNVCRPQLDD